MILFILPYIVDFNACNKKGGSPLSFSRYLTSKMSILHHFRADVMMAFYGKRTFLRLHSCIKIFFLKKKKKNRSEFFFQKLTHNGSMIEVYIKAKIWVYRRLDFRAIVHKMPDLLFFRLECWRCAWWRYRYKTFCAMYQLSLLVGYRLNLSRTFIRHDCHRRKSAYEGRWSTFSLNLCISLLDWPVSLILKR